MRFSVHSLPRQNPAAGCALDTKPIGDERFPLLSALLADRQIAYTRAHNAAYGCFAARIERY